MLNDSKKSFIKSEIYILAWNASAQRNAVYNKNCKTEERVRFRKDLILYLDKSIFPKYGKTMSEEDHYNNILDLKKYAEKIGKSTLLNQSYKIGTAQKLLNLSLKYFWCIGLVIEPPHCPVDRIILGDAGIKLSWTKISTIKEYRSVINDIRKKIDRQDLAQWELEIYRRR